MWFAWRESGFFQNNYGHESRCRSIPYGCNLVAFSHVGHNNYPIGFNENICKLRYCEGSNRQSGRIWISFPTNFFSTLHHENLWRMRNLYLQLMFLVRMRREERIGWPAKANRFEKGKHFQNVISKTEETSKKKIKSNFVHRKTIKGFGQKISASMR